MEDFSKNSKKQAAALARRISNQQLFNDKKYDTSSILVVKEAGAKDKSVGSKTSMHESKVMSRQRSGNKKKSPNSMVNEQFHTHSGIHSKTSVDKSLAGAASNSGMTTQNAVQEQLNFFDQVAMFKNYFPDANVVPVLEKYDKKRRKIMFMNEMKLLSPENHGGNIVLRKGTHIVNPMINFEDMNENENLRKWNKYTFYPSKMQENTVFKKVKSPVMKKRKKESDLPVERRKSMFSRGFGLSINKSKKSNFFGEVMVNQGEKKGFTDFVFDIMKDPRFAKWKKLRKGKRFSQVFRSRNKL